MLADRLFERLHGIEVVLLADVIETTDDFGVGIDVELLAAREQELLIDHVAEQIFLAILDLRGGDVALLRLGGDLLLRALIVAVVDDLVVDANDWVLDDLGVWSDGGRRGGERELRGGRLDGAVIPRDLRVQHLGLEGGDGKCGQQRGG